LIEVEVYLHTTLVQFSPNGENRKFSLQLSDGSTIQDLVDELRITNPAEGLLFGLNGEVADEADYLKTGDIVHIMMPISGG
jgi:sulfur carrier protein ThiS